MGAYRGNEYLRYKTNIQFLYQRLSKITIIFNIQSKRKMFFFHELYRLIEAIETVEKIIRTEFRCARESNNVKVSFNSQKYSYRS